MLLKNMPEHGVAKLFLVFFPQRKGLASDDLHDRHWAVKQCFPIEQNRQELEIARPN